MPPSTKRRSRKETNEDQGGETLVADSSPSRPAKRRKRVRTLEQMKNYCPY